jgi:hypothetical protein
MLSGNWKESNTGRIEIHHFRIKAFRTFLDWLVLSSNESFCSTDAALRAHCICSPHIIRQVLPIANYFATDELKDLILASAKYALSTCVYTYQAFAKKPLSGRTNSAAMTATNIILAVESSLPEDQVPEWESNAIRLIHGRILCVRDGEGTMKGTQILFKEPSYSSDGMDLSELSRKTLQKVVELLHLHVGAFASTHDNTEMNLQGRADLSVHLFPDHLMWLENERNEAAATSEESARSWIHGFEAESIFYRKMREGQHDGNNLQAGAASSPQVPR